MNVYNLFSKAPAPPGIESKKPISSAAEKVHDYQLSQELLLKMEHFTSIPERELEDMTIEDYFGKDSEFFHSSLWWCYHSMLAFKPYHSALEAQRYFNRFGLLTRLDYLEGILHTKRNEKDSIIKPIQKWLEKKGVAFRMDAAVYDLQMDSACNTVSGIKIRGTANIVPIGASDLVFLTSGSMMTNACYGDNTHLAQTNRDTEDKDDVIAHSYISTCMMPYITSQFMPRKENDRPKIVPDGCTNLAFIGQFVEVPRDLDVPTPS